MFVPLASAQTLNLFVYIDIFRSVHISYHRFICIRTDVVHMCVTLRMLTLRTSLYTYIYSQVHIFHVTKTFVYDSVLCELTYVCALASAHTQNLFVYTHILTSIYRSYHRYFYI